MTIEAMNFLKPREGSLLATYVTYVSEEGLDLERFVEDGGRLVCREDSAGLRSVLADLRGKINDLHSSHPHLARQIDFLAKFFEADAARDPECVRNLPEAVCNEIVFALFYAAKDMDLIPDETPLVGYRDDSAVVEMVLSRHAGIFEHYCATHGIDWAELQPEITN